MTTTASAYQLMMVSTPPSIDASRTVLETLLPPPFASFVQWTLRRYRQVIIVLYLVALVPIAVFPCLPPSKFIVWSDPSLILLHWLPLLALALVSMIALESRVELILLAMKTYEFWFLHATIIMCAISLAVYLQVPRIGIVIVLSGMFAVSTIVDSIHIQAFHEVILPIFAVFAITPFLIATFVNWLPNAQNIVIFKFPKHSLAVREVIIHSIITLAIFALRSTWLYYKIRTRQNATATTDPTISDSVEPGPSMASIEGTTSTSSPASSDTEPQFIRIRSISYRCRIYWQPITIGSSSVSTPTNHRSSILPEPTVNSTGSKTTKRPMHFAQTDERFDALEVQWPRLNRWIRRRGCLMNWLITISWTLALVSFLLIHLLEKYASSDFNNRPTHVIVNILPTLALAVSLMAVICFFRGLYHPSVLGRLYRSFDFLFMAFQFTLAFLCMAEVLFWDWRFCCLLCAAWSWTLWLLTLDACLPETRVLIGLSSRRVSTLLAVLILMQMHLGVEILILQQLSIQDRLLFQIRLGATHTAAFSVVSSLLARFVTLIPWCCRLLWRHAMRASDTELLILRGSVEYDGQVAKLKPSSARLRTLQRQLSRIIRRGSVRPSTVGNASATGFDRKQPLGIEI